MHFSGYSWTYCQCTFNQLFDTWLGGEVHYNNVYWFIGGGDGTPLQYSCLENPMDGGAWEAVVHGVAKSQTRLSDFTFIFHFHALEKEMATHSSILAWRIPGTGESGGLPSMGSHRVGHDWSNLAAATIFKGNKFWHFIQSSSKMLYLHAQDEW